MYDGPSVDDEFCRHFCLPSTPMDYIVYIHRHIRWTSQGRAYCLVKQQACIMFKPEHTFLIPCPTFIPWYWFLACFKLIVLKQRILILKKKSISQQI